MAAVSLSFSKMCIFCTSRVLNRRLAKVFSHASMNGNNLSSETIEVEQDEEFRVYEIPGLKPKESSQKIFRSRRQLMAPRYMKMPTNQDWTNVWPTAATFKHSVVPLPLRQGFCENFGENEGVPPAKHVNAELMKIPNFLHLTKAHVKKQCAAIKKFCSDWPVQLHTDEDCERCFPVEITTSDYLFSSPSIRDERARTVTLKVKLDRLQLDDHAKDKFIHLVGNRYDPDTGILTLTSDRCPTKKQNYDYLQYILTACYFESWKHEDWESGKTEADMLSFCWEMTPSRQTVIDTVTAIQQNEALKNEDTSVLTVDEIHNNKEVNQYQEAVTKMADEGENEDNIKKYKQSVLDMLRIPQNKHV